MEEEINKTLVSSLQPEIVPEIPKKNSFKTVLLVILGLLIIAGAVYVGFAIGKKRILSNVVAEPTVVPQTTEVSPTPDETANWKTYTNITYGLSFKYPPDYKVEERIAGFIVISAPTDNAPQSGISIDARQLGPYQSFTKAQANINTTFIISKSSELNGWMTFDTIGKEGMLKDIKFKLAIAPYKTGAIEMETIDNEPHANIFDQILSTFKFTNENDTVEGRFCGGIAANLPQNQCPEGYTCKLDGDYPDAFGKCVKI